MHLVAVVGVDVTGNVYERGGIILVDADAIACCSIRIGIDNNVAVDGKLVSGINDNVTGIDGRVAIFGGVEESAATNCNLGVLIINYLGIIEAVGVVDGQVLAFDGYGSTGASDYCGIFAVDGGGVGIYVDQCFVVGIDGVCFGVEFGIFSIDIDLRFIQLVVFSRFVVWDGVTVSPIIVKTVVITILDKSLILVDVGITVQVHVGSSVFYEGELLDFFISAAKVDGGAWITVNGGGSSTAGSGSDSEGIAFNVDYRQGIIGFQRAIMPSIDIICIACRSKDSAPGGGNCCVFSVDINKAAIATVDGIVPTTCKGKIVYALKVYLA